MIRKQSALNFTRIVTYIRKSVESERARPTHAHTKYTDSLLGLKFIASIQHAYCIGLPHADSSLHLLMTNNDILE